MEENKTDGASNTHEKWVQKFDRIIWSEETTRKTYA
jgi:hypothetical protein